MSPDDEKQNNSAVGVVDEPPEWMAKYRDGFSEALAFYEPDILVEFARYSGAFPYEPQRDANGNIIDPETDGKAYLYLLIQSIFFKDARSVDEWLQYASTYPSETLTSTQLGIRENAAVKVRAHFLKEALRKLLGLLGAPAAMTCDLEAILDLHRPRSADKKAEAQRHLAENPTISARSVAKKLPKHRNKDGKMVNADHSEISGGLKDGSLVRPSADYLATPESKVGARQQRGRRKR
jgi:hypothetical protein